MKHRLKAKLHDKIQEFLDDELVKEHWGATLGLYSSEFADEGAAEVLTDTTWSAIECMIHQKDVVRQNE